MYYLGMKKRKIFRAVNFCIVFLIVLAFILPPQAQAARRRAGGGEIAKFNFGNYAAGVGIGIGAMAVGGVINSGLTSAMGKGIQAAGGTVPQAMQKATEAGIRGAMWNSLSYSFTTTGLITNMSTFMAVSQVGRAVGAAGTYYGWKPSTTFLVSSGISAAVGGFMNPTVALGPSVSEGITNSIIPGIHYTLNPANYTLGNMLSGAFVGGLTGLASGAVIVAIDGNKINKGKEPGIGAQIAGMVTGVAVGNLTRTLIDPATYTQGPEKTWERVNNPEIKNKQKQAEISIAKTGELQAQGRNKFLAAAGSQAAESLYNDYKEGRWQNIDLKGAAKDAWNSGVAATTGDIKAIQAELTAAQDYTKTAANLGSKDSTRYAYRHVLDADVWGGYAQPDGKRTPVKYEMVGDKIRHYSPNDVMAAGRSYKVRPLQGNFVSAAETGIKAPISLVGQRLFEATFINTFDMWPQLVTNSLVIAATSSLGKKQKWMAPLVSGVVSGVAGPLLSNLADVYALRPGIYIGEHHIAKSLANIELVKGLGFKERMGGVADKMYAKLDNYLKDHKDPQSQTSESLKVLQQDLQGILSKHGYKTELNDTSAEQLLKKAYEDNMLTKPEAERILNNYKAIVEQPAAKVFGLAMGAANVETQGMMLNKSVNQGLRDLGISRSQLFLNSASRDMAYGLVEGVINGGIQSLASKVSEKSPFAAVGIAYGANMLSGAVRGAIWHATWTPSRNELKDLIWMPKYSLATPEKYGTEPGQDDRVWQALNDYTYPRELNKLKEFRTLTGLSPVNRTKEIFDRTPEGVLKTKEKEIQVYELEFKDKKPSLDVSILASLAQANRQFLSESFSFGTPFAQPENINALMLHNFVSNMRGYAMTAMSADLKYIPSTRIEKDKNISFRESFASIKDKFSSPRKFFGLKPKREEEPLTGWLTPGIISGYISGGSSAISTNILTSMGAVKPLADTFNIQHQRLVLTNSNMFAKMEAIKSLTPEAQRAVLKGSTFVPVTVQNLDYEPWLAARRTSFYAPFPSDSFGARNKKGKTFLPGR